jgi:1-acyl-sn-glycerol-3-phosphate acyltransferase
MSDTFYKIVRCLGYPAFGASARPTVLHVDRIDRRGPLIIAPNHLSPYDVPCLMASTRQALDFVSIVELFRNPVRAWFFGAMNALPLDRRRVDPATTRRILDRLERGRKIVMFPEGRICNAHNSLLAGGSFNPSVARLARLADAPIVPCVILATGAYARPTAWLPLRRTRYGVIFGEPLLVGRRGDERSDCADAAERLRRAYRELYAQLHDASGLTVHDSPWRSRPSPTMPDCPIDAGAPHR